MNQSVKYIKRGIILLFIVIVSGCSSLSKYERTYADNGKQIITRQDGVEVQISKKIGYWNVYYVNNTSDPLCVVTSWEVVDLTGSISQKLLYVKAYTSILAGRFNEQKWAFKKLNITVGGSGHIDKMYVIEPYEERKNCTFPKGQKT